MKVEFQPVQVIGLKRDIETAVRALYKLNCLDIVSVEEVPGLEVSAYDWTERQRERMEAVRSALAHLEALMETLSVTADRPAERSPNSDDLLDEVEQGLGSLRPRVERTVERRRSLEEELESLPRYRTTLRSLMPYVPAAAHDPKTILIGVLVSRRHRPVLAGVRRELTERMPGKLEFGSGTLDSDTAALLIAVPESEAEQVDRLIGTREVSRLRLPEGIPRHSPAAMLSSLEQRLQELPAQLEGLEAQLAELADEWGDRLSSWRAGLLAQRNQLEILERFGETEDTFVVAAWTPRGTFEDVVDHLEGALDGAVYIAELPLSSELEEKAPVRLRNPRPAESFEGLVELLGLPDFASLDPSPLMAVFLPLFFGMMLGDVGYGALLLAITITLSGRFREGMAGDIIRILRLGAGWTILFGLLYGEAFGTLGHDLGMEPIWFDRGSPEYIPTLLAVTVGVGGAHVALGLALGVWEALQHHSRSHLLERGGKLVALLALFLLVGALVGALPEALMTPSVAAVIVGVVLLGASMGKIGWIVGPIELFSLVGNVLSYMRIAAIGLASVYLATVANQIAGALGSLVVGVIIAVLLHALNLVMGTFSPTIHSLRLHYVEFFQKFYETGGRPYTPFGRKAEIRA